MIKMKRNEPTINEMIDLITAETNEDGNCVLTAYPGCRTIVFKWRDSVTAAHKMKIGYDVTEMFYIAAIMGPKDTFFIRVRDLEGRKQTFREKLYTFLCARVYVSGLFYEFGYRYRKEHRKTDRQSRGRHKRVI